jgi:BlaI family penicillinase repressor
VSEITPPIADAEWTVMEVVWRQSPIAASAVIDALGPTTCWHASTIKTLLGRLVKKGCLKLASQGYRYEYVPAVTREECLRQASESFVARFFGGAALPMVLHFAREGRLRKEDLAELHRLLDSEESGNA